LIDKKAARDIISGGPADIESMIQKSRCSASQGFPWFALSREAFKKLNYFNLFNDRSEP
jgi:hypothetical protein